MHTHHRTLWALASVCAALMFSAAFAAQARELDPQLRQYVFESCSTEAYRLCPQSLNSEHDAVVCMKAKRTQLNKTCRVAYDKVVHTLAQ